MTSRNKYKGISTGVSVLSLLVASTSMADINQPVDIEKEAPIETTVNAGKAGISEVNKTKLEDLSDTELVQLLANEDFHTREKSGELLWRRGKPALGALEEAVKTNNPELISRASGLIRYIKIGISPDTPPRIAKLVQAFADAEEEEQEDILRDLYAEKAYSQMLFMLSEMEDQELAQTLYEQDYNRLAHQAAKESLAEGDVPAAIELLKLAPKNDAVMRSLAYLYAHAGRLDEEIEKLGDAEENKDWERHLYMEKTNRADIRKYAQRESHMGVIANLDLLEGDPTAMFDYYAKRAPFIAKTGISILKVQYDGESDDFIKNAHAKQAQTLKLFQGSQPTDLVSQLVKSMCLTGATDLLEPYIFKRYQYDSFSYLDRRERPKEALKTIGITDEKSLLEFIQKNTKSALKEFEMEEPQRRVFRGTTNLPYSDRLLIVAEFYYGKGQYKTAKDVITPLLKELMAQESNEWYKVVETIAHKRMHDLAIELVLERGNGDNTYEQMVTYLYDDTMDTDLIWNTLLKRDNVTPEKAFRDLAVIMGVYKDEIKTYLQLQDELINIATKQGLDSLKAMRSALLSVAMFRQDANSSKIHAKQLLDTEDNKEALPFRKLEYLRELTNSLDWKAIVELLDKDSSFIQSSARWYSVYSIAKRKLGDEKEADRLLSHAKLIGMGLIDELRDIAQEHYQAGYYEVSTQIMERILIAGSVERDSRLYQVALGYLSAYDNAYTHTQQWSKSAAFFLVKSAADMVEEPSVHAISNLGYYINTHYNTQFTRGMDLYQKGNKAKGLKLLTKAHHSIVGDGNLADHFYPAIRTTDLKKQYELWVEESYQYTLRSIEEFPNCVNTHNSIAWILSRAVRKLDEALRHSQIALKLSPNEAAYIDTMGEIWFAKGNREKAVEWGEKAVKASKFGRLDTLGRLPSSKGLVFGLANQLERFRTEPYPKP